MAGLLVFLVALIDTANLGIACAGLRACKVAVRKAAGADMEGLRLHFVIEGVVLGAVALVGAFSLVELTLPAVDALAGLNLSVDYRRDGPVLGVAWSAARPSPGSLTSGLMWSDKCRIICLVLYRLVAP